jgi:hypothetical protein
VSRLTTIITAKNTLRTALRSTIHTRLPEIRLIGLLLRTMSCKTILVDIYLDIC